MREGAQGLIEHKALGTALAVTKDPVRIVHFSGCPTYNGNRLFDSWEASMSSIFVSAVHWVTLQKTASDPIYRSSSSRDLVSFPPFFSIQFNFIFYSSDQRYSFLEIKILSNDIHIIFSRQKVFPPILMSRYQNRA